MFRINKRLIVVLIMLVIFMLSNVVNAATQCEVDQIKHALRKMLYKFYSNPNTAPFSATEVRDLLLFYLSIEPNAVTIDCSVLGSSSNKAIFDIINAGKNVSDDIPKCTDGTQYGQCSGNRPKYCYAGAIYEKCETCGCPSNSFCGKSGKCESTIQNISCYNNIDCGTNKFVGDYYCSYNSIYKNMINYTCVNPGTNNSRCATVNGSVWLAYCNPSLNQICVNEQSTCQTNTTDAAPTVAIAVNPTTVAQGQAFNVTVTGTDDIGLAAIWWWASGSTDTELSKAHWYSCYGAKICTNSWLVSTNAVGTIKLGANSRDTSYPVAGEAHQASEGAGIAYATITVTGATNVSNVSGGLPDLIISDFKSYTGTTNTYVTISATIKNIGGSATEGNLCDSLYVETLNARGFCGAKLNPGETRVIQSDYALPMPGTYKIRADTDYGLLVAESNENNNVAWQTITVTSPYSADYVKANTDLTVTDIDVQLPATSSEQTRVYVTTKNLGNLATGQYWVYTKVTNQDTGIITKVQRLAPVVEPGGTSKTYHGEVGIKEYGTYKVEAFVDLDFYGGAYIYESNEDNNYLSKTVVYGSGANETTTGCVDSDDTGNLYWGTGKNYYVKGYCNSTNGIFYDECFDSTIREAFCSNLDCAYYDYSCTYGCQDGACICPAPYHVLGSDGRCVWSCGVGTTPSNVYPFECVCKPGLVETSTDQFGRRVCMNETIQPSPSVKLIYPNGGEQWTHGQQVTIRWSAANITSARYLTLKIWKGDTVYRQNLAGTPTAVDPLVSGTFSATWIVPSDFPPDNDYKFEVLYTADIFIRDLSDAPFSIIWSNQTNETSLQTCTGVSKIVDFENPPHLSFHLTWNPDLGTQDSYNYNLDETARTWLKGKGLVINGTPNGIIWGTGHSGPAGNTGVVIGDASPNFAESDQGISDNEILSVHFIDALTKSVTVGLTVIPSDVSLINNIPATITLEAYDTSNNIVGTATKTFTGVTNGVYTPTTMSLSATDFKIAKITLRTTQHPYGGVWLEDISFLSCT